MSVIEKLTEGIINRNLSQESDALLSKWEKTGLLEGIEKEQGRQTMACLLENQAKELLREASAMASGDVEGFAAVAFPIVRRVFGGLVANDLVSVQPMSLPSGLIFFLDFTYNTQRIGGNLNESLYGGDAVASEITGGVSLTTSGSVETGYYNLNNGYASPTGTVDSTLTAVGSGTFGGGGTQVGEMRVPNDSKDGVVARAGDLDALCRFDADFTSGSTHVVIAKLAASSMSQLNTDNLVAISSSAQPGEHIRRLNQWSGSAANHGVWKAGDAKTDVLFFFASSLSSRTLEQLSGTYQAAATVTQTMRYPITDNFTTSNAAGSVIGTNLWGSEQAGNSVGSTTGVIPEIDIKVDSVSITAITKKLKAKWTPELQQDINAYHNLDAEVELTSILSETIALEIDQEILNDLVLGATAGRYYWSRKPGKFLDRTGGQNINETNFPDFTGTVSEWYETLLETVNDVSAQIHRKTLRGGANFLVCGPEAANLLEFTNGFRASTTGDEDRGDAGAVKTGTISKKWDVYVDPYFPRNVVLVGRKGGSFLESGYVYAPYVPLQTTPTIFGTEDFVPRKGVMTRYGKKMVRPDMYGIVVIQDLV